MNLPNALTLLRIFFVPVLIVALGTFALANVVSILPGRVAGRTPTATLLRSE